MSSIYRKGRDGYYYYQTYVYNPDTGKNDKRIFYSLGTKEKNEAEKKQIKLDFDHENKKQNNNYHLLIPWKKITLIVLGISILMLFLTNIIKFDITKLHNNTNFIKGPIQKQELIDTISTKYGVSDSQSQIIENIDKIYTPDNTEKKISIIVPDIQNPIIPQHTIVRVEQLSGAFNQGKIYVTINKNSSIESMRMLCAKIKNDYKKFSNIIICLYSDNIAGNELAKGNKSKLSTKKKNKSWMAMYSYNTVEGEYFDDNPGGYLGVD